MSLSEKFHKSCFYLGDPALFVWLYQPLQPGNGKAIVLCPPLGHEYVHTHRSYRYLAEHLAARGMTVLRPDLHGTGDSAGSMLDNEVMEHWQQDINLCLDYLQQLPEIIQSGIFGVRMGATLAMLAAAERPLDFIALWNPIVQGKRYLRELQTVNRISGKDSTNAEFFEAGGFPVSTELAQTLEQLTLQPLAFLPPQVAVIGEADDSLRALFAGRSRVASMKDPGFAEMMAEPQFTQVPVRVFSELMAWLDAIPAQPVTVANRRHAQHHLQHHLSPHQIRQSTHLDARDYTESAARFGDCFAIVCQPQGDAHTLLVLANSGSVHHCGPNRLYTILSRELAAAGIAVIRLDLSNLGDSASVDNPDENTTYPDTAVTDMQNALAEIKTTFPDLKLVLGGICSGAHTVFHTALASTAGVLDKVLIINPLTFYWEPGMSLDIPVSYEVNKEAKHYQRSLTSKKSWKKLLTGQVDYGYLMRFVTQLVAKKLHTNTAQLAEIIGLKKKTRLAEDLARLINRPIQTTFVFSQRDPGYGILMEEGGISVSRWLKQGRFSVQMVADADHTFSRNPYRVALVDVLNKELGREKP